MRFLFKRTLTSEFFSKSNLFLSFFLFINNSAEKYFKIYSSWCCNEIFFWYILLTFYTVVSELQSVLISLKTKSDLSQSTSTFEIPVFFLRAASDSLFIVFVLFLSEFRESWITTKYKVCNSRNFFEFRVFLISRIQSILTFNDNVNYLNLKQSFPTSLDLPPPFRKKNYSSSPFQKKKTHDSRSWNQ